MSKYDETTTPAICEDCLGPNQHISLRRVVNGAQCKVCTRSFTLFKWNSQKFTSARAEFKRTAICLTCARSRNCCQCCMRDLLMGVGENVKDHLVKAAHLDQLKTQDDVNVIRNAKSVVSRLYNANALEERFAGEDVKELDETDRLDMIDKLSKYINESGREADGVKEKKPKQALPKPKPLPKEALVKLMKNFPLNGTLKTTPTNEEITMLFLFGVNENTPIYAIKEYFLGLLGESKSLNAIESIIVSVEGSFGYIKFSTRSIAEKIASLIHETQSDKEYRLPCSIKIKSSPVRVCWAHKQSPVLASSFTNVQLYNIAFVIEKQMTKLDKA